MFTPLHTHIPMRAGVTSILYYAIIQNVLLCNTMPLLNKVYIHNSLHYIIQLRHVICIIDFIHKTYLFLVVQHVYSLHSVNR